MSDLTSVEALSQRRVIATVVQSWRSIGPNIAIAHSRHTAVQAAINLASTAKHALVFARIAEHRDDVRDCRRTEAPMRGSEDIDGVCPSLCRRRQIKGSSIVA
jgi:hypothetical protein